MDQTRVGIKKLAEEFLRRGDPMGWFEVLYARANGDASAISWTDMTPNPNLIDWLGREGINGHGQKALVVGCGLGDDAEALAERGFEVVAFDISSTAIQWCHHRFPNSKVNYCVADLFSPLAGWACEFDLVFEAYTLQVLPRGLHQEAIRHLADWVAPSGTLLVISRGRDDGDEADGFPWPLSKEDLAYFKILGLVETSFEDYMDAENPPVRRFRGQYERLSSTLK